MSKHAAHIVVLFNTAHGFSPEETADTIVRDLIDLQYDATLDDLVDIDEPVNELRPSFICPALEGGHGDDFMATFVFTPDPDCPDVFVCEGVDLLIRKVGGEVWFGVGGVGGEVEIMAVRNSDGSLNTEQMCRDWLGVWHRHFVGATEDSIHGVYLMIKQIVSEGQFNK